MPVWGADDEGPVPPERMKDLEEGSQDIPPEEKVEIVADFLEINYSDRIYEHPTERQNPFEVLIACILSQRTRDENTDAALEQLFPVARTPEALLDIPREELQELIRPAGTYRQKSKMIHRACEQILEEFNGEVPETREELMSIYGIGPKCADIVLMYGHGIPSIAIDTHCDRVPRRIGLVDEDASKEDIKAFLEENIEEDRWYFINTSFVKFGREVCKPRHPQCGGCPLNKICDYYRDVYREENQ